MTRRRPDLSPIARLYADSLTEHGVTPKGVGWHDTEAQKLRFDKLTTVIESEQNAPITINDLGCGYGALLLYLSSRGINVARYYGCDVSDEMLKAARLEASFEGAEFIRGQRLTHTCDYSFASGIFNVRLEESDEDWVDHVKATLYDLDQHSRVAFAFNMLTTYADYREAHLYYGDPLKYFDFCKRNFSPRISLLHDYPLFEWTITVQK